jgi:hypothetical protein
MGIGNKYQAFEDSHVGCIGCGTDQGLFQVASRLTRSNRVTGYVFTCEACFPDLVGKELIPTAPPSDSKEGER